MSKPVSYYQALAVARRRERNFSLFWELIESKSSFRVSVEFASNKISNIRKYEASKANLTKARYAWATEAREHGWRNCEHPGVPCFNRLMLQAEDAYTDGSKKLMTFCSGLKCELTVHGLKR